MVAKHHMAARSLPTPPGVMGERIGKAKARKLMDRDKDNLTSERKKGKKQVMQNQSLATRRLMPSWSPSNGNFGKN